MKKSFLNKLGYNNANVRKKDNGIVEDATEYGEFIASFDAWMTPEEQKKRAEHLQNLGKEEKSNKN